jgi:hypothetical protein
MPELLRGKWRRPFEGLEREWEITIGKFLMHVNVPAEFNGANVSASQRATLSTALNLACASFASLPDVDLTRQHLLLMRCLGVFDRITRIFATGERVLKYAIKIANRPGLISVFMICGTVLMKKNVFQRFCTVEELEIWVQFEEVIAGIVALSQELSTVYYTLQAEILQHWAPIGNCL